MVHNEKYLLDSHILIWWFIDSSRLDEKLRNIILNNKNTIYISAASIWELHIKSSKNKIDLPTNFINKIDKYGFTELRIDFSHASAVEKLDLIHKDPFDRMLITQAILEDLTLVSSDEIFEKYKKKYKNLKLVLD